MSSTWRDIMAGTDSFSQLSIHANESECRRMYGSIQAEPGVVLDLTRRCSWNPAFSKSSFSSMACTTFSSDLSVDCFCRSEFTTVALQNKKFKA